MSELTPEEQAWADAAASRLRQQERQLDTETAQALAQARNAAITQAGLDKTRFKWWQISGLGAAATAMLLLALYTDFSTTGDMDLLPLPALDELEMAAAQDAELLEDLEFVAWIVALEEADDQSNQG